jgi:hypothetical protein
MRNEAAHGTVRGFVPRIYMKLNPRLKIYTQTTSWVYSHSFAECDYVKGNVSVKGDVLTSYESDSSECLY